MVKKVFSLALIGHGQSHPDIPTVRLVEAPTSTAVAAVSRSRSTDTESSFETATSKLLTYAYENQDSRAITGYKHMCIVAMNDGRTGWTASAHLAPLTLTRPSEPIGIRRSQGRILPGERIKVRTGVQTNPDTPYGVQSCGLVAVTFEGGEVAGAPEIVEEIYAERRAMVMQIEEAKGTVRNLASLSTDHSEVTDVKKAIETLRIPSRYEPDLSLIRQQLTASGRVPRDKLEDLANLIDWHLDQGMSQLRRSDLELINKERADV